MVVIIIIAIGAAIAIPNMSGWFGKKNLDSISLQMFSDFHRARSEAITRGTTVLVQIKTGTNSWYSVQDQQGNVIIPQTSMPQGTIISGTTFPLSGTINIASLNSQGFEILPGTGNPDSVTIQDINAPSANRNKTITLSLGGAMSIAP